MSDSNKCKFCDGSMGNTWVTLKRHYKGKKCQGERLFITSQLLGIDLSNCDIDEYLYVVEAMKRADEYAFSKLP